MSEFSNGNVMTGLESGHKEWHKVAEIFLQEQARRAKLFEEALALAYQIGFYDGADQALTGSYAPSKPDGSHHRVVHDPEHIKIAISLVLDKFGA